MNQQKDMRILMLDCSAIDFVKNEDAYLKIKSICQENYSIGIHKITL
jgi:hypothetical protein